MVYLGSAIFKIARLTFIALFFVHLFACIFFRIKETSADSLEDVAEFYSSKRVEADVSGASGSWLCSAALLLFQTGAYHKLHSFEFSDSLLFVMQDLPNKYVRTKDSCPPLPKFLSEFHGFFT